MIPHAGFCLEGVETMSVRDHSLTEAKLAQSPVAKI